VNGEALRRYRFGKPDAAHARLNLDTPRALLTEGLERTGTALAAR
jgi:bifunctional pyridoxal-dependent enzyme with beta-cystathionase and maltose regulon repressor activities